MANTKKKKSYDEIKEYAIYVIMDTDFKQFYVATTPKDRLSSEYWDHYKGKKRPTRELFQQGLLQNKQPNMYYLSELECTKYEADSKIIPYIRFFLEFNMKCLNSGSMISHTKNLNNENMELYNYIKQYKLEELCNENTNRCPDYTEKQKKRKETIPSAITINLTEAEYLKIKKMADEQNMKLSKYAKQSLLYKANLITVDFENLNICIQQIHEIDEFLKQLLYTIYETKTYYTDDLLILQNIIDKFEAQKKEILHTIKNTLNDLETIINV